MIEYIESEMYLRRIEQEVANKLKVASTDDVAKAVVAKGGFSAPYWFDVTFDICIVGLLAWYSCYWTASAYLFHMIMIGVLRNNVKEVMNETH